MKSLPWRHWYDCICRPPVSYTQLRGGRHRRGKICTVWMYFNSRPREGADRFETHARCIRIYFNSRPREGADFSLICTLKSPLISTHGPARGPTTRYMGQHRQTVYFNSRPREGADGDNQTAKDILEISTHGPARGPTKKRVKEVQREYISTHGPARGPTKHGRAA